jgi:glycosyltransferase involved in cell wall biosynthesis
MRHATLPTCRVLVVHPAMAPYRVDLFNRLSEAVGLRVLFQEALPPYDRNLDRDALSGSLWCEHAVLADEGVRSGVSLARRLRAEVAAFRPHVLVTHEFGKASMIAAALTRLLLGGVRHVIWSTKNVHELAASAGLRRSAMGWLAGGAAAVLTYSAESADRMAALTHTPRERFFICANHQDPARLRAAAAGALPDVVAECRRLDLFDRRLVVIVSRLAAEKNVADAVAAFHQAFSDDHDVCLVIIGEGPLRPMIEAAAAGGPCRGRVILLGQRGSAEVQAWLAVASVSVLASSHEPFGAVVGESLSQGTPVLCSQAAGAASLIDEPSQGTVFAAGQPAEIAALLAAYRPGFTTAQQNAREVKPLIPSVTVADDVAGFVAAVSHAAEDRHG